MCVCQPLFDANVVQTAASMCDLNFALRNLTTLINWCTAKNTSEVLFTVV